ncbi:hypothetical protein PIB30_062531 [Stylosanthes scabra]|uniref:Uncharacterized protein n=1 Tax=Stylosanthes scabra TaxID=79078 RepID=A0ABU6RL41_9FABA|nr:hypothetical protein [Stylosanthes scabra]
MKAVLQSRRLLSLPTNSRNRFLHLSQALKHRFFTPKPRGSWLQLTPVTAASGDDDVEEPDGGSWRRDEFRQQWRFPQIASLSLRSPLSVLGDGGAVFLRWCHCPFYSLSSLSSPFRYLTLSLSPFLRVCGVFD